jgi:hypothetical protein
VNPQLPACRIVSFGTPESVANVSITVGVPLAIVTDVVCCAADVGVGLHCLYVGVPKALLVLSDSFM